MLNAKARDAWESYQSETDPMAQAMAYQQYLNALLSADEVCYDETGIPWGAAERKKVVEDYDDYADRLPK